MLVSDENQIIYYRHHSNHHWLPKSHIIVSVITTFTFIVFVISILENLVGCDPPSKIASWLAAAKPIILEVIVAFQVLGLFSPRLRNIAASILNASG